jgi:hypothetical protein
MQNVAALPVTMLRRTNDIVADNVQTVEMIGVCMRIVSFALVSWLGSESPFLFVWTLNTVDALMLSWCALLRRDRAYILLNTFWVFVGLVGIGRAAGWI